jgi:hypothetical protein
VIGFAFGRPAQRFADDFTASNAGFVVVEGQNTRLNARVPPQAVSISSEP